jgi:hypothetical protein
MLTDDGFQVIENFIEPLLTFYCITNYNFIHQHLKFSLCINFKGRYYYIITYAATSLLCQECKKVIFDIFQYNMNVIDGLWLVYGV